MYSPLGSVAGFAAILYTLAELSTHALSANAKLSTSNPIPSSRASPNSNLTSTAALHPLHEGFSNNSSGGSNGTVGGGPWGGRGELRRGGPLMPDNETMMRGLYVLLGVSAIVVLYFIIRAIR